MGFSFTDFIIALADGICQTSKGSSASPYELSFGNHYKTLYDFENDNQINRKHLGISKVIQDKKTKSITADFSGTQPINDKNLTKIRTYCEERNIDCDIQGDQLKSITIGKNSKGVLEERQWQRPSMIN